MNDERGGAGVLLVAMGGIAAAVGIGAASLGLLFATRERAVAAAEAAALAAAVATYPGTGWGDPISVAAETATANGARLLRCSCPVDAGSESRTVLVFTSIDAEVPIFGTIEVRGHASAEFQPEVWRRG